MRRVRCRDRIFKRQFKCLVGLSSSSRSTMSASNFELKPQSAQYPRDGGTGIGRSAPDETIHRARTVGETVQRAL